MPATYPRTPQWDLVEKRLGRRANNVYRVSGAVDDRLANRPGPTGRPDIGPANILLRLLEELNAG
jgi:hypothetical protein